jgi:RNA polymerase sigma-70 factor (ECF subfamily)
MAEDFERVVREYQDRIFRLAWSLLRDHAAAEEAAQDALLRVWRGLPRFRGTSSLSTWIYAITRNVCLSRLARRREPVTSLEEPATRRAAERGGAATAEAVRDVDVAELLDRLPAKYREVVVLYYMQEKSYEEVAAMLGMPEGTVKTYLFRARKSMAEEVARKRVGNGVG